MEEPQICKNLREIFNAMPKNARWYREVSELTCLETATLTNVRLLRLKFKPQWGNITLKTSPLLTELTWIRPDKGPNMTFSSNCPTNEILIRVLLKARLIEELQKADLLSFVRVGYPDNWNRTSVFVNDVKQEHVIWACALTGICLVLKENKQTRSLSRTNQIIGHVTIPLHATTQTLF